MKEGLWNAVKRLREGKEGLAKNTAQIKDAEKYTTKPTRGRGGWGVYDNGAHTKDGYFKKDVVRDGFESLVPFEQIKEEVRVSQEAGEKVLVLDVMGQGRVGVDMGADLSIGWTYKRQNEEELPGREIETGDLMKEKDLAKLFKQLDSRIKNQGYKLDHIFYRAIGGFGVYADNDYALSYMYDNILRELWKRLSAGGRVYLVLDYSEQVKTLMSALEAEGIKVLKSETNAFVLTKGIGQDLLPSARILAARYGLTVRPERDKN